MALWHAARGKPGLCNSNRVFVATLDRRLIAVDAETGGVCPGFGRSGVVDLAESLHLKDTTWYEFTSPPTVVGDVVVLGSSVGDNQAIEVPSGAIRGFDARSGKLLWTFEPLPWAASRHPVSGSGGVWSVISADPKLGLIYLPTGSPSVDFYAVNRPGDDRDANSVVALNAATGKRVWAFQTVHHDIWDYDIAAEPLLFTFRGKIPAVAITTKTGMVFVLDRRNGAPLFPVVERPVPQSDVAGEQTSPTQPFSSLPTLAPLSFTADQVGGINDDEKKFCHDKVAKLVNKGIFTPIGLKTTLLYPGSIGGVNWGSAAFDPETGILYANVNRLAFVTRLVPREEVAFSKTRLGHWHDKLALLFDNTTAGHPGFRPPDAEGAEMNTQYDTPYFLYRQPLLSHSGLPCTPQPWGEMVAMDLNQGVKLWAKPLGTMSPGQKTGSVSVGGPIVTHGGLIFSAATVEPVLRAFDSHTGDEVWQAKLPNTAQSTPMTYQINGRQYVVICAGGHASLGGSLGDSVIAFALPPGQLAKPGHRGAGSAHPSAAHHSIH